MVPAKLERPASPRGEVKASGIVDVGKHGPGLTWSRWSRWSHPVPVSMPVPAKLRGVVKGEHEHELGRGLDGNGGRGLSSGSRSEAVDGKGRMRVELHLRIVERRYVTPNA